MFSTMNGWPSSFCSGAETMRAMMSLVPPAGNGTMTLTGLVGQLSCASAAPNGAAARTTAEAAALRRERRNIVCLLL
jgi:hypothetical protein